MSTNEIHNGWTIVIYLIVNIQNNRKEQKTCRKGAASKWNEDDGGGVDDGKIEKQRERDRKRGRRRKGLLDLETQNQFKWKAEDDKVDETAD